VTPILSGDTKTLRGILPGIAPIGRSATVQTRTYYIRIVTRNKTHEVYDFLSYKNAHKALIASAKALDVDFQDKVAE
jgi:hypothetical protein